ncbi:MAG: DUF951 domain-containing protein [Acholeplasmataceae bacterium]|nr:DUF951 domain-containing protein [Acholeplasmataceae bacterium]
MKYEVGNTLQTKKKHVCGSDHWTVLRTGAEIRIKCQGCGREIMIFKANLDKKVISVKGQDI